MKIRITKKGLPKAQFLYSQIGKALRTPAGLSTTPGVYLPAIPAINEKRMQFNTLLGIQPSLAMPQQGTQISLAKRSDDDMTFQQVEQQAVPVNTTASAQPMYKIEQQKVNYNDILDPKKNPIFDDWKSLSNIYQTGSAKDFKNAVKKFEDTYDMGLKDNRLIKFGAKGREAIKEIDDVGDMMKGAIGVASQITDKLTSNRREKEFSKYLRNQQNSDALFNPVEGSRGDYVTTGSRFGEFRPDEYVVNRGMFAQYGGENTEIMKIRITQVPASMEMKYGGQSNYGLDLGRKAVYGDMPESRFDSMSSSISAVPRNVANIEAEGGETVYGDLDGDGGFEHMKISGPRHSQGGVPLNVPEGSFIFSDTAKMRIKDPIVLAMFGKSISKGKKGFTPAEIAKQYDINKYKAIMDDPNADPISKGTAQLMVKNYKSKLGLLGMVQEGLKGFPQGIPEISQSSLPNAAYGGYIDLPKAQLGLPGVGSWNAIQSYSPTAYGPGQGIDPRSITTNNSNNRVIVVNNKDKSKPSITIKEEDIFDPIVMEELKKKGYEIKYSPRIAKGDVKVPVKQSKQKSGLYGDVQMDEIAEFKARHPWYFANKPNWDPTNPDDVLDFQMKYDEEFAKQKGYSYFDEKKPFSKKDKKLGEYTYNAPGLNMNPVKEEPKDETVLGYICTGVTKDGYPNVQGSSYINAAARAKAGAYATEAEARMNCPQTKTPGEELPPGKTSETPFGYMTPDIVNFAAAAMIPPKKYLPYRAPINLPRVSPTFYDPNRAIAAQNEAANMLAQNAALIGNPQAFMANASRLQGTLAQGVADTMADVQNRNVSVANQFAGINADIVGRENMLNAQRANDLYDATVIANQQFDNARRMYNRNLGKSFGQAWNNRMNLGLINSVNPFFNVSPQSGRSFFISGYGPQDLARMSSSRGAAPGNLSGYDNLTGLKRDLMSKGLSETNAEREALRIINGGASSYTDTDMDGFPNRVSTSQRGVPMNYLTNLATLYQGLRQLGGSIYPFGE